MNEFMTSSLYSFWGIAKRHMTIIMFVFEGIKSTIYQ